MPATKTKRKVGSKDTARRVYEYERDKAGQSAPAEKKKARPTGGPAVSPIHLLPDDGLIGDTKEKLKQKRKREKEYDQY